MKKQQTIHLGFEIGTGKPVELPIKHMVVTGQTQESGKTTTLEALISRSKMKALAFITKRGEGSFSEAQTIQPYFRERADWKYVAAILEASRGEKLKYERAWIIRASKGASTLADVQSNVREALKKARGQNENAYLCLDAYLEDVVPYIGKIKWADKVNLNAGVNVMELERMPVEMQHLVLRSSIEWILDNEKDSLVVVPEAWKFIPQGRSTPVQLAAESFIRQAAGLGNYLWLDSQDIAGVQKLILKSVPVWLLGVQRESHEVKRTLDQIPAGIKKPKPEDVATLQLGQFFACWGMHVIKTYVQPAWMSEKMAKDIAMGKEPATEYTIRRVKLEDGYKPPQPSVAHGGATLVKENELTVHLPPDYEIAVGDPIIEPDNTPKPSDYQTMPTGVPYFIDDGSASSRELIREVTNGGKEEMTNEDHDRQIRDLTQGYEDQLRQARTEIAELKQSLGIPLNLDESHLLRQAGRVKSPREETPVKISPDYGPGTSGLLARILEEKAFINEVAKRVLPLIPSNGRVQVEPREYVLKDFLRGEVDRILSRAAQFSKWQKGIVRLLEAKGSNLVQAELFKRVGGKDANNYSGTQRKDMKAEVDALCGLGFVRKDGAGRHYPNLETMIKSELSAYNPTDEDIEQTIGQVLLKMKE